MSATVKQQTSLKLPKASLEPLLERLKIDRNALFSAWLLPEQGQDAATWWEGLEREERSDYEQLLKAVAAPVLLATLTMVEDENTVLLRCLIPSTAPSSAVYLIREEDTDLIARRLEHRDEAVDAIWDLLAGDFPLWEMQWGATLSVESFYTLLATADLQQRKEFIGLLEHTALGPEFFPSEVEQMIARSFEHRDLRWLLPFFLTVIPNAPPLGGLQSCGEALKALCDAELLEPSEQGVYRWSPSGEFLAKHWRNRLSVAGLQILGADHEGTPVASHVGFLRSRKFLWYMDLGLAQDQVVISTPTVSLCQELLDELLLPLGEPGKEADVTNKQAAEVLFCPYCGGKLAVADARFCNCCGKQLKE